ncbi:MAG: adenine deaminase [Bacteroidetes bacterium B1(2017)]|nr:MAG: adenine deaminase [Bacteroidetes bacterium B1(2017)]
MLVEGQLVAIEQRRIYPAQLRIENGIIVSITEIEQAPNVFIIPGFVDAHVHIESSLLAPSEFARMALTHGTIATISDPHEIANVLGLAGVEYMIENGQQVPFYFNFGAPSCVPATVFETAGAAMPAAEVEQLLARPEILYLSEMMNFPGVLFDDPEVHAKIKAAHKYGKPVDGHAPGLRGKDLEKYVSAGISTDHECYTLEEALDKIALGMKILIREGSAARNFDTLIPLLKTHAKELMFCSDDKHPDSLLLGHINQLAARAVALGNSVFDVLEVACLNPVKHYKMTHGTLQIGHSADFVIVKDVTHFEVLKTYIKGNLLAQEGVCLVESSPVKALNNFVANEIDLGDLTYEPSDVEPIMVCLDGQLITERINLPKAELTEENDVLKLVVVNRYTAAKPAIAYIKNFGIKGGAIAGSVAHDSHNIIAVGSSDEFICHAINKVIKETGALVACSKTETHVLPLALAGLMSVGEAWEVAKQYSLLDIFSKEVLGSNLRAPFMSLSFMALLVIPHLKLSDKGLFDGDTFSFVRN